MSYQRNDNNKEVNRYDVKPLRRELRTHGTPAEATLWRMLKAGQVSGCKFRRQYSVGAYVLDFYCPAARLAVELDGAPHFTPDGARHDEQRTRYLEQVAGIRVLRFENRMVFEQPENVLRHIEEALGEAGVIRKEEFLPETRKEEFLLETRKEEFLLETRKEEFLPETRKEEFLPETCKEEFLLETRKDSPA
ncbi:endonuclease domain-containing protein [Bacteroides sp.]|uniref:endonuclease domain-containing protein n=1 Tax=Bacteroides sp. TaxID=29523 RepID=UPI00260973DF|nr:endonuclease domain-containing protein [Bacteroides sp.]